MKETHIPKWTNRDRRLPMLLGVLVCTGSLISGCSGGASSEETPSSGTSGQSGAIRGCPSGGSPTDVTIQFTWKVKGEYAPFFLAEKRGFYTDAGMKVKFVEGTGSQSTLTRVATGGDESVFTIVPMNQLVIAVNKGLPLISVASFQPTDASALVAGPGVRLKSPKDLVGLHVGIRSDSNAAQTMVPMLKENGIDPSKVEITSLSTNAADSALLAGKVDVVDGFTTAEIPVLKASASKPLDVLKFANIGFPSIGNGVVLTPDLAKSKPDLIRCFLSATAKGIAATKSDPMEAARAMKDKYPSGLPSLDITLSEVKANNRLMKKSSGHEYGFSNKSAWSATVASLKKSHVIKGTKPLAEYYTNKFVE